MEQDHQQSDEHSPKNPLAALWSNLSNVLQIRKTLWERLLNIYLDTPGNENVDTAKNRATTKNRLTSQIAKPSISMNTFYKALRIAGFTRGTLSFRGWRGRTGAPIEVSCNFIINDNSHIPSDDFDIDSEPDEFFISIAHRYAYILIHLNGKQRNDSLGILDVHYESKSKASLLYKIILKQLNSGDLSNETRNLATEKLKQIYERMMENM